MIFPTHTSIFEAAALEAQILAQYDLPKPVRCHFFRQGLNDTYLVQTAVTPYYLRIYRHHWRNRAEVEAEMALLRYLYDQSLPVSQPVATGDGRYVHAITAAEGTRYAALFTAAPGQLHLNPTPTQSHALGQMAAHLHKALGDYPGEVARGQMDAAYFVERPLANIRAVFGDLPDEMELATQAGEVIQTKLATLTGGDVGLCHGDLHTGNVHFVGDAPTLFDFDCVGYGWHVYDLATFQWSRLLFEADEGRRAECWATFVAGYEGERALLPDSLNLIPIFVLARQLWVMGIHTSAVTVHYGRSWLNPKYVQKHFGFLRQLAYQFDLF